MLGFLEYRTLTHFCLLRLKELCCRPHYKLLTTPKIADWIIMSALEHMAHYCPLVVSSIEQIPDQNAQKMCEYTAL